MAVKIEDVSKGDLLTVWTCPYTGNPPAFTRQVCEPPGLWPPAGYMIETVVCVGVYDDEDHLLVEVPGPDCSGFSISKLDPQINVMEYYRGPKVSFSSYASDKRGAWVKASNIDRIVKSVRLAPDVRGGAICKLCGDVNIYAAPNQDDGSFVCYPCRQDPYRAR